MWLRSNSSHWNLWNRQLIKMGKFSGIIGGFGGVTLLVKCLGAWTGLYDTYMQYNIDLTRSPVPAWGPLGLLDFILRALLALRPCDPQKKILKKSKTKLLTNQKFSLINPKTISRNLKQNCLQIQNKIVDKSKKIWRQIQKISATNPKNFGDKSKKLRWQIQKTSVTNPKNFGDKSKKFWRQIKKISSTNQKNFVDKSKKFRRQNQKKLSTNPKNFVHKSKKFRPQIQKILSTNQKNFIDKSKNPESQKSKTSFFWNIQKALKNPVVLTSESHL